MRLRITIDIERRPKDDKTFVVPSLVIHHMPKCPARPTTEAK